MSPSATTAPPGPDCKLVVAVGAFAMSADPRITLTTYSLGSCLGITIYDPVVCAGGMLHAVLPEASVHPASAVEQPAMFIDTGLRALLAASARLHVNPARVQLCVAGGAQFLDKTGFFSIGERNCQVLGKVLKHHGLTVCAEELGGLLSRTLSLEISTGTVRVRTSGQRDHRILFSG